MIEVNTSYFWQTQNGVDARGLCASVPASLSRTQSEFGLAWANEMSTSKQASSTARLQLTLRRPVVSRSRNELATSPLTNSFPSPASGALRRTLISGLRIAIFNNHADMGVSTPVSAFFVSRNTSLPQLSA